MAKYKKVEYRRHVALLLGCLSLLIFGTCSMFQNGGINYTSLIASSKIVIPSVFIMYVLGWLIGSMMESSKSVKQANLGYANSLLEDILREEGLTDLDDLENQNKNVETDIDIEEAPELPEAEIESK